MSIVSHTIEHSKLGIYPNGANVIGVGTGQQFTTLDSALAYIETLTGAGKAFTEINGSGVSFAGNASNTGSIAAPATATLSTTLSSNVLTGSDSTAFALAKAGDYVINWENGTNTMFGYHHVDEVVSGSSVVVSNGARATLSGKQFILIRPIHYDILLTDHDYPCDSTLTTDRELPPGMSLAIYGNGQNPKVDMSAAGGGSGQAQYIKMRRCNIVHLQGFTIINALEFLTASLLDGSLAGPTRGTVISLLNMRGYNNVGQSLCNLGGARVHVINFRGINTWFRGFRGDDTLMDNVDIYLNDTPTASANGVIDWDNELGAVSATAVIKNTRIIGPNYDKPILELAVTNTTQKKYEILNSKIVNGYVSNAAIRSTGITDLDISNTIVDGNVDFNSRAGTVDLNNVRTSTGGNVGIQNEGSLAAARAKGKDRVKVLAQPIVDAEFNYLHGDVYTITLTAARLMANIINAVDGDEATFIFTQDATGGFAVTWNSAMHFVTAWTNTGNTAATVSTVTFRKSGAVWYQISPANAWIA